MEFEAAYISVGEIKITRCVRTAPTVVEAVQAVLAVMVLMPNSPDYIAIRRIN